MLQENKSIFNVFHEEQERQFYNPHLYNVTQQQWEIYGICIPTFVLLGLIMNSLIFATLLKDKAVSSLNLLLHCLSFYDILVGLFSFWVYAIPAILGHLGLYPEYLMEIHPVLIPYLNPILHMAITGSDYLNLAAACERYLATDRNFREDKKIEHHLGCTPKSTKIYIVKIFLLTVLFNVPAFFELETTFIDEHNQYEVVETDLRRNEVYTSMYRLMAEFLIFKVTPWFAFFVMWLSLNRRISFYTRKRSIRVTMTKKQFSEIRDVRLISGIIGLFYITNVLTFYVSFCHIMKYHVDPLVDMLSRLSLVLNSTFKFPLYIMLSERFRSDVKSLICQNPEGNTDDSKSYASSEDDQDDNEARNAMLQT